MLKAGIDHLLQQSPSWKSRRIGLVTNAAALTADGLPARKALQDHGFRLGMIFSPEHGLDVQGADGAVMPDGTDALTGLPVRSLYGDALIPDARDLDQLDLLLFDIPDAGCRFYTYLWTMTHCLEACAAANKKFVLLDRPNPLSGDLSKAEGPMLDEAHCASFIGRWCIPVRHSCTYGELARFFNTDRKLGCDLEVVCCSGWARTHHQPETGWLFTPTSPAIQCFASMLMYPGTGLLEATNLHEGRSTEQAFTLVAAPWLDPLGLRQCLEPVYERIVNFSETDFISCTSKYPGQSCRALTFQVTDRQAFQPVRFGLDLIKCIKDHHHEFAWAPYPTAVNPTGSHHLDRLLGIAQSTALFDLPEPAFRKTAATLCSVAQAWQGRIGPSLLY